MTGNRNTLRVRGAPHLIGLLGGASVLTIGAAVAYGQVTPTTDEEVTVTGSLIAGAPAVGVPITSLGEGDFRSTGAFTVAELLKSVPAIHMDVSVSASAHSKYAQRGNYVDLHLLGPIRALLLVNGMRYPLQGDGASQMDPGLIPQLSVERTEVLTDGSSAIYGADAVSGVINVILKRRFNGAITQLGVGAAISDYGGGMWRYQAAQLYGTTWDGGDVTIGYEFNEETELDVTAKRLKYQYTQDYRTWNLDDRTSVNSSMPGTVSTGAPSPSTGTTCSNCYAVPGGTGWDFGSQSPAPTTTWAALQGTKGVNQVNPFAKSSLSTPQQRNSATLTFDQEVYEGVELFVDAFYQNRRVVYFDTTLGSLGRTHQGAFTVPTVNPYYPTGAPSGLRVNYNFAAGGELGPRVTAGELALRWAAGFNFKLPFGWLGKAFYQVSENRTWLAAYNLVHTNNVLAALGNTISSAAASGTIPAQSVFTKPANVPFLNLFCDPTAYECNSPTTLNYVASGFRDVLVVNKIRQWSAQFNGPLLSLPAGDVRGAVGVDMTGSNFGFRDSSNRAAHNAALVTTARDAFNREVPAAYVQVNVPVFGENNAIPLFDRLQLEGSYRVDSYDDFGEAWSPKVGFDWDPVEGLSLRGSWGRSFRTPGIGQLTAAAARLTGANASAGDSAGNLWRACPVGSATPVAGSPGAKLVALGLASCDPAAPLNLQFPGGLHALGSNAGAQPQRPWNGTPNVLGPERSINITYGFDFTPTFAPGLQIGVTYWKVKVTDFIFSPGTRVGGSLQNPGTLFMYSFPDDPEFAQAVKDSIALPFADFNASLASNVTFLLDAADRNIGTFTVEGIDFQGSYDLDMAEWGIWRAGISGSYYLDHTSDTGLDAPIKLFDNNGVPNKPRFRWRSYVGWMDESFSVTVFVNYMSHYFHQEGSPPAATLAACGCDYSNYMPNYLTGDLALGYNTGVTPTNAYLQNLNLQLVISNVLDNHAPFAYYLSRTGAYDSLQPFDPVGRRFSLTVTKTW